MGTQAGPDVLRIIQRQPADISNFTHSMGTLSGASAPEPDSHPGFVNHAIRSLSTIDLDALVASHDPSPSGERAAARASAISVLRAVLASVLLSPAHSPTERARILEDVRSSFSNPPHHLDEEAFSRVLSDTLPALSEVPLVHEVLHWDPIWEGVGDTGGAGVCSVGMESIQFMVEHWRPPPLDSDSSLENGVLQDDSPLLSVVRAACLRRLLASPPPSAAEIEETTNRLFQRLLPLVYAADSFSVPDQPRQQKDPSEEKSEREQQRRPVRRSVANFSVSITSPSTPVHEKVDRKGKGRALSADSTRREETGDVTFTAFVSFPHFVPALRDAALHSLNTRLLERERPPLSQGKEQHMPTTNTPQRTPRRQFQQSPYARFAHGSRYSMSAQPSSSRALRDADADPDRTGVHSHSSYRRSLVIRSAPARATSGQTLSQHALADAYETAALRAELLTARHAWALEVGGGPGTLKLRLLGPAPLSEPHCVDGDDEITVVEATVRVICPPSYISDGADGELTFTLPRVRLASLWSRAEALSPCAMPFHDASVRRLDDARLLHDGELMLELSVRIFNPISPVSSGPEPRAALRALTPTGPHSDFGSLERLSPPLTPLTFPSPSSYTSFSPPCPDGGADTDMDAWSELSFPSHSGSSFSVLSVASPPGTPFSPLIGGPWAEMDGKEDENDSRHSEDF